MTYFYAPIFWLGGYRGRCALIYVIISILPVPMFPMAGHSVQRIWTRFGVRPPYNLRMVKRRLFCRETARHPSTVGSFRIPHVKVEAAAAAAAISRGHATCGRPPLLWMGVRVGVDPGIPIHGVGIAATTAVVSQTTRDLHLQSVGCGMRVVPRYSDRSTGAAEVSERRGRRGALAPAMLKPRGREYLFAPAIFSHIG